MPGLVLKHGLVRHVPEHLLGHMIEHVLRHVLARHLTRHMLRHVPTMYVPKHMPGSSTCPRTGSPTHPPCFCSYICSPFFDTSPALAPASIVQTTTAIPGKPGGNAGADRPGPGGGGGEEGGGHSHTSSVEEYIRKVNTALCQSLTFIVRLCQCIRQQVILLFQTPI